MKISQIKEGLEKNNFYDENTTTVPNYGFPNYGTGEKSRREVQKSMVEQIGNMTKLGEGFRAYQADDGFVLTYPHIIEGRDGPADCGTIVKFLYKKEDIKAHIERHQPDIPNLDANIAKISPTHDDSLTLSNVMKNILNIRPATVNEESTPKMK